MMTTSVSAGTIAGMWNLVWKTFVLLSPALLYLILRDRMWVLAIVGVGLLMASFIRSFVRWINRRDDPRYCRLPLEPEASSRWAQSPSTRAAAVREQLQRIRPAAPPS